MMMFLSTKVVKKEFCLERRDQQKKIAELLVYCFDNF